MKDVGFVDLQVNGYAGVDFNQDHLTAEDLHRACQRLREDDVSCALATIISEHLDLMCQRLARLVELRERDPSVADRIVGFHIEGPFLNGADGYRGAHPRDAIIPADVEQMHRLLDASGGLARIVTLAPEHDVDCKVTRLLAEQGVTVSAGHCDPTLDQLDSAIDAGLSMFTHLGNGCPMQMHRHDNVIQRVLSRAPHLWLSFIADGVHVPYHALRNYIGAAGVERCVVVTDAMAAAGLGPGRHRIGRWDLLVGDDMVARAPDGSHLVGSALSMKQARNNLLRYTNLSEADVDTLTVTNPCIAAEL